MELRARTFLIDLRGDEPTSALSARLGYPSDVVAEWEAGRRWPTAGEFLRVCAARRIDVPAALRRFDPQAASAFGTGQDDEVATWLQAVCDTADARRIARDIGRPAATVRRWLGGQVRPRLPEVLALVESATGRSEDLLQALLPRPAEPEAAPPSPQSARARTRDSHGRVADALDRARRLRAAVSGRRGGPPVEDPVPVAVELDEEDEVTVEVFGQEATDRIRRAHQDRVWRAVASVDHAALGRHRPGWLEARTHLSVEDVADALGALEALGRVRWAEDRWEAVDHPADLAADGISEQDETPLERLIRRRGAQVVISLARPDLDRVRSLERRTQRELEAIADSAHRGEVLTLVRADL